MKWLLFILLSVSAQAANVCVWTNSTGSGSGADWNNTIAKGSVTYTRGNAYYFAAGSYTSFTLSTAVSGSSLITIKSAQAADHGTDTGWNAGTMAGVLATPAINPQTSYWTIDGLVRGTDWRSGYGIAITSTGGQDVNIDTGANNITFRYIDMKGRNTASVDDAGINMPGGTPGNTNITVSYCYLHETGNSMIQANGWQNNALTVEYCWFYKNHRAQDATHDEGLAVVFDNLTVRYSYFQDITSTGIIADPSGGTPSVNNWTIYGNVFFWDTPFRTAGDNVGLDNGVVGLPNHDASSGVFYFFNNTIWNIGGNASLHNTGVDSPLGGADRRVYNNIWYNCDSTSCSYPNYTDIDYNSYYACGNTGSDTGAHRYTNATQVAIFTDTSTFNLRLVGQFSGTTNGITEASYATDMDGVTRGADGVWDRGAYEFVNGGAGTVPLSTIAVGNKSQIIIGNGSKLSFGQ